MSKLDKSIVHPLDYLIPAPAVVEATMGDHNIERFTISPEEAALANLRFSIKGQFDRLVEPGDYVKISHRGERSVSVFSSASVKIRRLSAAVAPLSTQLSNSLSLLKFMALVRLSCRAGCAKFACNSFWRVNKVCCACATSKKRNATTLAVSSR